MWLDRGAEGMAAPFWGQVLSSGSWWLHNINDSASAEMGSRSGHALYTRSHSSRGGLTPPKDSQRPMTHAQNGPEEWTAHAHSFTWTRNLIPRDGKLALRTLDTLLTESMDPGLVIFSPIWCFFHALLLAFKFLFLYFSYCYKIDTKHIPISMPIV